jgi:hypothetical protein
MFNFQYEIKIGEDGRPYISPLNETDREMSFIEHKFMAIELCRTFVAQTILAYQKDPERRPLPPGEIERLLNLEDELIRFSNIFAKTIREQFDLLDIADRLINKEYDISVDTIEERDDLNYNGIIFQDRIFKRVEGLRVRVLRDGEIYELKGGVDNEHWTLS